MATIHPYLFFGGRCEDALAFYKAALGATVDMVMRFNESPQPVPAHKLATGFETKIMHSQFRVADNVIMASDGTDATRNFAGFSLCLSFDSEPEVDRAFKALSSGGKVVMPLAKTFYSARYGMLTDPFGVNWMVMVKPNRSK